MTEARELLKLRQYLLESICQASIELDDIVRHLAILKNMKLILEASNTAIEITHCGTRISEYVTPLSLVKRGIDRL